MYDSVELLQAKKLHLSWGIEPPVGLLLPVSHTAKFWRKSNAGQQTFCALTETAAAFAVGLATSRVAEIEVVASRQDL